MIKKIVGKTKMHVYYMNFSTEEELKTVEIINNILVEKIGKLYRDEIYLEIYKYAEENLDYSIYLQHILVNEVQRHSLFVVKV